MPIDATATGCKREAASFGWLVRVAVEKLAWAFPPQTYAA
jgi:hypothetical protein